MPTNLSDLRGLVERTNHSLGHASIDRMNGDNLAVTLCSHFDNPDQDEEDENGWTPDATEGCDETLKAIRAHYAPVLSALLDQIEALQARCEQLEAAVRGLIPTNVSLNNTLWPDSTEVPIDVTMGELRAAARALHDSTAEAVDG